MSLKRFALFIFALFCTFIIPFSAPARTYGDEHASQDISLARTPAKNANAHLLYFRNEANAVAKVTAISPTFKGRLSTIRSADRVVVLHEGRIVEPGKFVP